MSSGPPMRPSGAEAAISSPRVARVASIIFDSKGPGATALTVMMPRPEPAGQHPGELVQAGLAGRVGVGRGFARQAQPVDAADVDHPGRGCRRYRPPRAAAGTPGSGRRPPEVEVDDLVPAVRGELLQGAAPVAAGVVDQDVDALFETGRPPRPAAGTPPRGTGRRHRQHGAELEAAGRGVARLGLARADVDPSAGRSRPRAIIMPIPRVPPATTATLPLRSNRYPRPSRVAGVDRGIVGPVRLRPAADVPVATVRARMPSVARSAPSETTGKIPASRQCGWIDDQS